MTITKSDFNTGKQCEKRLWLSRHQPSLGTPATDSLDRRAEDGIKVGQLARLYYPGGHLIDWSDEEVEVQTQNAITRGVDCLYEAAFRVEGEDLFVRCDILRQISGTSNEWHLIEAKSGTSVRPDYITDVAFQTNALRAAGLTVSKVAILHVNNHYLYDGGEYDPISLFTEADVTSEVDAQIDSIRVSVKKLISILEQPEPPNVETNRHCADPPCEFHDHCHSHQPEHDVIQLPRITAKQVTVYRKAGYRSIGDIPVQHLKPQWTTIWNVVRSGVPHYGPTIGAVLARIQYPLHFIDFESVACALPLYPHTRPYQQILFQWSNHILHTPGDTLRHEEFLHTDNSDPRSAFADSLWKSVKDAGTIVVYSSFEASRLRELANDGIPWGAELSNKLDACALDILKVVKDHVYHPAFKGSYSVKTVLPALVPELSYAGLPIHDGDTASLRFLEMQGLRASEQAPKEIAANLLEYCGLDTLAMVRIFERLIQASAG